jgi:hypothetical protein
MSGLDSLERINALVAASEPESDVLEFKELISNGPAARTIAAMANHRGGHVLFGIREENGRAAEVSPIDLAGASERVANIARDGVDEPLVLTDVAPLYVDAEGGVLVVRIELSQRAPHFVNGQAFTRSGPTTRPMTAYEIGALFARRGERFVREYGISLSKPPDVVARLDSERRPTGMDSKGRLKERISHRLVLANRGDRDAHNVTFRLLTSEGEEARTPRVLVDEDPTRHLRAGTEVAFVASVTMGGGRASQIEISWLDDEGQAHAVTQSISI